MDRIKWNVKNGQIMNKKSALLCGAFMGGLGVAFGAFGAHALKPFLAEAGRVETFELAVRYQFYHAFALLITGLLMNHFTTKLLYYSAIFFCAWNYFFLRQPVWIMFYFNPVSLRYASWRTLFPNGMGIPRGRGIQKIKAFRWEGFRVQYFRSY